MLDHLDEESWTDLDRVQEENWERAGGGGGMVRVNRVSFPPSHLPLLLCSNFLFVLLK